MKFASAKNGQKENVITHSCVAECRRKRFCHPMLCARKHKLCMPHKVSGSCQYSYKAKNHQNQASPKRLNFDRKSGVEYKQEARREVHCHFSGRSNHVGTFQWPFTCPTQRDLVTLWRLVGYPRFPAGPKLLFIFLVILHFLCFRRNLDVRIALKAILWAV